MEYTDRYKTGAVEWVFYMHITLNRTKEHGLKKGYSNVSILQFPFPSIQWRYSPNQALAFSVEVP
jgi:hypothetical protein